MKKPLLIEIGHEELPAGFVPISIENFKNGILELLKERGFSFGEIRSYATPRRTALLLTEVSETSRIYEEEVQGPPYKVAYDSGGRPTRALEGFLKKFGLTPEDVRIKETKKGKYVVITVKKGGESLEEVLRENLLVILSRIPFPKTMRWQGELRFGRPIRWLIILHGERVLDVELDGVKAGNFTYGNRFFKREKIFIKDPMEYEKILEEHYVIADLKRREKQVKESVKKSASFIGGQPIEDNELLKEVTNLVEYPRAVVGQFDRRFLKLPEPVIVTAMKQHQRYFAVYDKEGKLLPNFVAVVNNPFAPEEVIKKGLEEVLIARLEDAEFYFMVDTKRKLESRLEDLKGIVWLKGLGTIYEKVMRVKEMSVRLAQDFENVDIKVLERAALLYKADLSTEMIRDGKEFTKLEGLIGMHYALKDGEPEKVAKVIYEGHLPRFAGDKLPETKEGIILSIADKIDTITGLFSINYQTRGAYDPLGLRKTAYALIDILVSKGIEMSVDRIFEYANFNREAKEKAIDYILKRFEFYLEEKEGMRYDIVDAVLNSGIKSLPVLARRARVLNGLLQKDPENFEKLVIGQKRLANILGDYKKEEIDPELFEKNEEKELFEKVNEVKEMYFEKIRKEDYESALQILLSIRPYIDRFFDNVFVMTEDKRLRENRLSLLAYTRSLYLVFADFSKIVIPGQ